MTFSTDTIKNLIDEETLRFKIGEGDLEFKEKFDKSKLFKIMAAMSNSNGGIIVYGVDDNGFIVGLDNVDDIPDSSHISQLCQSYYSETIRFETCQLTVGDKKIFAFKVYKGASDILAVCVKDGPGIHDGEIYLRHSGMTEKIRGHALSRYMHKIHQKAEGDLSQLQKKELIVRHQPRFKSGTGCGSSATEIKLVIRNDGEAATLLEVTTNSSEINIHFNAAVRIQKGEERHLPVQNLTSKPGGSVTFELLLKFKDALDNTYTQKVMCTGGHMKFEEPSISNN